MFFRHFDKLKSFSGKEKANKTYDFAKPYFVMVMNFVWIISYGTAIYVFDALNTLRIQARKEPFIALAALATIIYAVFAYNQWQVMRGQLDEMQTESAIRRDELMARMKFAFAAG